MRQANILDLPMLKRNIKEPRRGVKKKSMLDQTCGPSLLVTSCRVPRCDRSRSTKIIFEFAVEAKRTVNGTFTPDKLLETHTAWVELLNTSN